MTSIRIFRVKASIPLRFINAIVMSSGTTVTKSQLICSLFHMRTLLDTEVSLFADITVIMTADSTLTCDAEESLFLIAS